MAERVPIYALDASTFDGRKELSLDHIVVVSKPSGCTGKHEIIVLREGGAQAKLLHRPLEQVADRDGPVARLGLGGCSTLKRSTDRVILMLPPVKSMSRHRRARFSPARTPDSAEKSSST